MENKCGLELDEGPEEDTCIFLEESEKSKLMIAYQLVFSVLTVIGTLFNVYVEFG